MNRVYLSLGSNIDREFHITSALDALHAKFGELTISRVYESESVGFDGSPFYNLVVGIQTELDLSDLSNALKQLEDRHGRDRQAPRFASRTLDIDIVTYDDQVGTIAGIELPRPELYYNAFVLWPMAELRGSERDPKTGHSYAELWAGFSSSQRLRPVSFMWRGVNLGHSQNQQ